MKKVAILGKLSTKYDAPFKDLSYDIWTMNLHKDHNKIPRIDICFDLHKVPQNPNADILKKDFPFKECQDLVGGNFFNNTVSYLIAYAILQGYEKIELYGMRFACDHERRHGEFLNVQCLIAYALGKGIDISAPSDWIMLKDTRIFKKCNPIKTDRNIIIEKRVNPVLTSIKAMNEGVSNILLKGYRTSLYPLIFYGRGCNIDIVNENFPLKEFPSYENINGKDFDWY